MRLTVLEHRSEFLPERWKRVHGARRQGRESVGEHSSLCMGQPAAFRSHGYGSRDCHLLCLDLSGQERLAVSSVCGLASLQAGDLPPARSPPVPRWCWRSRPGASPHRGLGQQHPGPAGQFACHELLLPAPFRLTIAAVLPAGRMVTIVPLMPVMVRAGPRSIGRRPGQDVRCGRRPPRQ